MTRLRGHAVTLVGTFVVMVGMLVALLQWSGAAPWGGGDYRLRVLVPTAGSMGPGASVRIAGLRVGKVKAIERRGPLAVLTLQLQQASPLPEDTRAAVRLRTLVGENYVELYPGTSGNDLPSGAALALRSTNDYVEADEVLSVLRGRTRERARATIQALGAAVDDQGPRLNAFLDHATGAVDNATDVATVLAKDHVQVAGLVDDAGQIMGAVGDRATAVEQLSRNGRLTFEALARRAADLRATLVELPATLASVQRTSALLGDVTTDVAPVVNQISVAVGDLEPAVTALEPAADEARLVLRELTATAPGLATTLGKARAIAPSTVKALPQVKAVLCQLNPAAAYLRPYARDLTSVLANLGSSTNFYDATGHAARLYAMVGQTSFAGINDQAKDALDLLQQYGLAGTNESNGYNPYPAPGDAGRPSGGEGGSGPSDYPAKYPRVRAAC